MRKSTTMRIKRTPLIRPLLPAQPDCTFPSPPLLTSLCSTTRRCEVTPTYMSIYKILHIKRPLDAREYNHEAKTNSSMSDLFFHFQNPLWDSCPSYTRTEIYSKQVPKTQGIYIKYLRTGSNHAHHSRHRPHVHSTIIVNYLLVNHRQPKC
jgi:hypothetical protein